MFSISTRYQILAQILADTGRKEGIEEDAVGLAETDGMEAKAQPRAAWQGVTQRALQVECPGASL